ncbi:hypothetical protein EDD68_10293 [Melghiribacillus thermohalophilus]|uniref:N-acetyltransferase domain-containing protein n=1 Tax=Melghiribacillus thermohalophilus TaxID=1324956 RepID=A0A4R3NCB5_9BACI|nr:hypothetical protein [Melghiribacillus thermohalophilus]TCT26391.1 hypothetical protein EDD68_10293 [Melghiribacillus thermohalophilus]
MIQVIKASQFPAQELETYFGHVWDQQTDQEALYEYGRYMLLNGEKKGFFAIVPAGEESGWLRALYMKGGLSPAFLMMVFEWVQQEAVQAGFQQIYVLTRDESTETLLEINGFQRTAHLPARIRKQFKGETVWVWKSS